MAALSTNALASHEQQAFKASGRALFVYSGAKSKIDSINKRTQLKIKSTLIQNNLVEEAAIIGITAKILSEKRLNFEYEGKHFVITPRSIEVKIPF